MRGIVFSTQREAEPFLMQAGAEPVSTQPFLQFRTDHGHHPQSIVVVSGMGKVAAAIAATHLILSHRATVLINAGLCGRLRRENDWTAGDLLRIHCAVEGDMNCLGQVPRPISCDDQLFATLPPARLVTCDHPVFEAQERKRLSAMGDLADMEGAAVARVATLHRVPCAMIKGISDDADETGRQDIARNIDWVSQRIADALMHGLFASGNTDR